MPARFDDDALLLRLSVADVLERQGVRRIGFAQRGGFERLWVGQAIHSRYQERALAEDGSYRREVALTARFEHRGWTVELYGRADGVRRDADGTLCIEEIKSVRRGAEPSPTALEMYGRQAALYAWILGLESGAPARAEVVLIEIGSDEETRIAVPVDARALEAGVRSRINALLREHEAAREAAWVKRRAAERMTFPFHQPRPGQEKIVTAVEQALAQREHLLVEAVTGLGKTVAALYPVLRRALEYDQRVYVLTAKNLQQEMATSVLELLNTEGAFHSLRLRAKARMCANHELICHEDYCEYARDYSVKLGKSGLVQQLLGATPHLEPDQVFAAARERLVCPFETSLEIARASDVVVCDYNYAFEPFVALTDFAADADLSNTILVVDEIHNLVQRGRGYYSPELSADAALSTAETIERSAGAMTLRLSHLCRQLAALIRAAVDDQLPGDARRMAVTAALPADELWRLRPQLDQAFVDYLEWRRENRSFTAEDPFVALYFDVLRFLNTLALSERAGDEFSPCLEIEDGDRRLRLLCKDASRYLGAVINRCHSVIGLSATLSPSEFYRDLLGFDPERTSELEVASPFPRENRAVVIESSVATEYRARQQNYGKIAERLGAFACAVPGNCLVLFPSYAFLAEVADRLELGDQKRVIIQRRTDNETHRQEILETLRTALFGDVLLLAVAGGVFAEGVDYPGDMLKAVAVVGPCLPTVSLEQKLLQEYYEERFGRGFEYAFVIPGMTRVVQAAGRLIRSATDSGVIALFGRRFCSRLYRRHMPPDWFGDGLEEPDHYPLPDDAPRASATDDPATIPNAAEVASLFFAELESKAR